MANRLSLTKRCFFTVVLALIGASLLVLLDRLALRFIYRLAPPAGLEAVASLMGDQSVKKTGFFLQHPYLHYSYLPHYRAFGQEQFNSRGHRSPEVTENPAPGVLRILAIGGSTTVSFAYVTSPEEAWPLQAGKLLQERTGMPVEVINAGLTDANVGDLLMHYMFRNRYLAPDIVIMHVGLNDGVALLFDDYNPEYTHFTHGWQNTSLASRKYERMLLKSGLLRIAYAWWMKDVSLAAQLGRDDIRSMPPERCLRNARTQSPAGLDRNLDLLVRTVKQDGAIPVLFPPVWAPPEVGRHGGYGDYYDAMDVAFRKSRESIEALARRAGLAIVRVPLDTLKGSMFVDFCHLNLEGETIKARYVADAIMPLVEKLKLKGRFAVVLPPQPLCGVP